MMSGHFSRTFLWALSKQKWLRELIPAIGEDANTLEWYVDDGEERPFMIIKTARKKETWAPSVAIHKLESDGKFWTWEKHRWDADSPLADRSLIKSGRYPASFRGKKPAVKLEKGAAEEE